MLNAHHIRSRIAAALAVASIGFMPAIAHAIDLSSNLANATAGVESVADSRWLAVSFGTGSAAHTLTSVTLLLANPSGGAAQVSLYNSAALEPAALVGTLTSPAAYSSTLAQTTFTTSGIALTANTTYWIVLQPIAGQFDWAWTSDNSGAGVGFQRTWCVSDDAGAFWWSHDIYQTQVRVTVVVCLADINGSGTVDVDDLIAVILSWGCTNPPGPCPADVNASGVVDVDDLIAVILGWGACQ